MPMIDLEDAAAVVAAKMAESLDPALEVGYAAREQGTALGAICGVVLRRSPDGGLARMPPDIDAMRSELGDAVGDEPLIWVVIDLPGVSEKASRVAVAAMLFPRRWLVDSGFATEQQLGGAPAVWLAHCSRCAGKVGALPEGMPLLLARQTPPEELH